MLFRSFIYYVVDVRLIIALISIVNILLKKKMSITIANFIHSLNPLKKNYLFINKLIVTMRCAN